MRKANHIYIIIALAFVVLIFSHATSFLKHNLSPEYKKMASELDKSPLASANLSFSSKLRAGYYYVINARVGKKSKTEDSYTLQGIKGTVYFSSKKKKPYYTLQSKQGNVEQKKKALILNQNVVLKRFDRTGNLTNTLHSDELAIDFNKDNVTSTKNTTYETPQYVITGDQGLKILDHYKKIFFLGNVTADFKHDKTLQQDFSLRAKKYLYLNKSRHFYFATDKVSLSSGDIKATSDNYLVAIPARDKTGISNAFAQGNITLASKDIRATGQSFSLNMSKHEITLWGHKRSFGYYDRIEKFPAVKNGPAIVLQGNNSFQGNTFVGYLNKDPKTKAMYIRQLKAFGHVVAHNQSSVITGDVAYYNTMTKIAMICGHARVVTAKSIIKGRCIRSNFNTGESSVVGHKQQGQVKLVIFQ